MKNTYTYDQMGRQTSFTIPDGSVIKYTYNAKGQLTAARAVSKENGLKMNSTYTYNAKGKLVRLKTTGDYPSDIQYEYGADGLLKKEKAGIVNTYEYSY
jgi:YD repeat-containing protein